MKIDNSIAAVVTGGASGLGRASAEALAAAGVKVAIFDISDEAGEAFAREIGGVFCKVDITDEDSVLAGFEKARAAHGQERVVVHCAVVAGGGKTVSFDKATGGFKRTPTEQIVPGTASAIYGRGNVRLQQIVWPDPADRFPWDPGYQYPPHTQPLLTTS